MQRKTNVNGMKAIIKHNVFKQLKRITKVDKQDINEFIDSLSFDELKQKGLTKQIVDQFKNGKPRKILTGGMKRERAEPSEQPIKRTFTQKLFDMAKLKSIDDEKYTLNHNMDILKKLYQ